MQRVARLVEVASRPPARLLIHAAGGRASESPSKLDDDEEDDREAKRNFCHADTSFT